MRDRDAAGRPMILATELPEVYPPREDTFLLLPFARGVPAGESVLEIGTGNGAIALAAARTGTSTVATDLNREALRRLRRTALAETLSLQVVRTDLARGLGRFDRILANPPYLPTAPEQRDPDRWVNLALDGGPDGAQVIARLVETLPDHLTPTGRAFVVVSSVTSPGPLERVRARWVAQGGRLEIAASRELESERLEVWELYRSPGRRRD